MTITLHARLIQHLDDCFSVEEALVIELRNMAIAVQDPTLRVMFDKCSTATQDHGDRLAARLRALDALPTARSKSALSSVAAKIGSLAHDSGGTVAPSTQLLFRAFAIDHFEMDMYEVLGAYAEAIADQETVALALALQQTTRSDAERVWTQIGVHVNADLASSAQWRRPRRG